MWNETFWIQLGASLVGATAYAVFFRLRFRYLPWVAVGGTLTFFLYYVIEMNFHSVFAAAFVATAASAVYCEICARWKQAPAVIFLLPCAIPIVPGGSLYRTMYYLISKETELSWYYFGQTISVAIGIAGGIALISLLVHLLHELQRLLCRKKKTKKVS